jgi:hypothetical protein
MRRNEDSFPDLWGFDDCDDGYTDPLQEGYV